MKKGFTLIELLAVIVILAIIVLITSPIVLNLINEAEESANLKSAEFYMKAVEQAILKKQLKKIKVPNGTYEIMSNGNLCIGTYNRSSNSCSGNELEVDVVNPPKGGTITIENKLTTDYTITLENDQIVTNIKPADNSCFEYMDNYDYTINKEVCINAFSGNVTASNEEKVEPICSGDKTYGDLITIANYLGYSVEQLESNGIISNVKKHDTVSIAGYKCGGDSGTNRDVVIPSKIDNKIVTKIGVGAFLPRNPLTGETFNERIIDSVVIPNTVTTIEYGAFARNQLANVTIPNSVTEIGGGAFENNQLTNVTIPNSVTTIGDFAFESNNLTSVTIPNGVTTIGEYAFYKNQLTSVTIPNSVTTIGEWAFSSNQLTSVIIPNGVTTIGEKSFVYNKLKTVTIGSGIISIGSWAFATWTYTDSNTGITYGPNALENVHINRNQSDVTLGEDVFGWADGYSEDVNLHWNSTGPKG